MATEKNTKTQNKLEKFGDRLTDIVSSFANVTEEAFKGIGRDVEGLADKAENYVDEVLEDPKFRDLGKTVVDYAKKGKKETVKALKSKYEGYQGYLDEKVQTKPNVVGFWDGYVSALLDTETNRRPGSQMYKTHVKYGKGFGYGSSVLLFTSSLPYRVLLGGMPVYSRAVKYFNGKLSEAKEKVSDK